MDNLHEPIILSESDGDNDVSESDGNATDPDSDGHWVTSICLRQLSDSSEFTCYRNKG